jgi:hypothetical protein
MRLITTTALIAGTVLFTTTESFRPINSRNWASLCGQSASRTFPCGDFPTALNAKGTTSSCNVDATNEENVASVTAATLRSISLLNVRGERIRLGDVMTEGTSIVVFLRHLG